MSSYCNRKQSVRKGLEITSKRAADGAYAEEDRLRGEHHRLHPERRETAEDVKKEEAKSERKAAESRSVSSKTVGKTAKNSGEVAPGGADLVDVGRRNSVRDASAERDLAGGRLP